MAPGTDFSAAPSALGYLFQVRYALVLLLRADEPETLISIEKLDDVAFEQNGEPEQLLQLKHHVINSASLRLRTAEATHSGSGIRECHCQRRL